MLTVEVRINERLVARAVAVNVSDLAEVSDYGVAFNEEASEVTGLPAWKADAAVRAHPRRQSVWELVWKIAAQAAGVAQDIERGRWRADVAGDWRRRF